MKETVLFLLFIISYPFRVFVAFWMWILIGIGSLIVWIWKKDELLFSMWGEDKKLIFKPFILIC